MRISTTGRSRCSRPAGSTSSRLISETFAFEQSIAAFDRAVEARPSDVKLQIKLAD